MPTAAADPGDRDPPVVHARPVPLKLLLRLPIEK